MEQITVVIGDRPGKGQKVAGRQKRAVARSSRTGRRGRTFLGWAMDGKSGKRLPSAFHFAGSGGAGAITAQNATATKAKYGMRSVG